LEKEGDDPNALCLMFVETFSPEEALDIVKG